MDYAELLYRFIFKALKAGSSELIEIFFSA